MGDLDAYRRKRNFDSTPEPHGEEGGTGHRRYCIQKHAARRLHYDLRLELDGVLLSWAVPKGPSLDPHERRLAIRTEDHPLEYADFEGTIPAGHYGAGRVLVWDRGTWTPDEGEPHAELAEGRLHIQLHGEKLRGRWTLVEMRGRAPNWLLIKSRDSFARPDAPRTIVDEQPNSVISGRGIDAMDEADQNPEDPESVAPLPLPSVSPQLATLVERPPSGSNWLHEIKLDGYRLRAHVIGSADVRLYTRGDEDWTGRLPEIASELRGRALANSVLDGELCVIGPDGLSRFEPLQRALATAPGDPSRTRLVYIVFDLPFAGGQDLRERPLLERKRELERRLAERAGVTARVRHVRYGSHVIGPSSALWERTCALGAEGVVSKRVDSIYAGRRTRSWRKAKCPRRQTVVIAGYTAPQGSRQHFGAVLVGIRDAAGDLRYRGKVGSGFDEATLADLARRFEPLRRSRPAFVDPPVGPEARGVQWLEPTIEIDVDYSELTQAGRLRQARFCGWPTSPPNQPNEAAQPRGGWKEPKVPTTHAAKPKQAPKQVRLTHPGKLLYPEFQPQPLSKRDVAEYIMQVAEWMLPHVRDRPLTLVRCPDGVPLRAHDAGSARAGCFYQKQAMPGLPASVARVAIASAEGEGEGEEVVYASVRDALGLVGLVQMSVLEIHPWGSLLDDLERPDRLVFDLDPAPELEFDRVIAAAFELRDRLLELGLRSVVKTSGGKGLHVVVPIARRLSWAPAKQFCRALAGAMVADAPNHYVALASKAQRRGKIFIDYLRNGRGATSVAPYSLRATAQAPVSTPLAWDELEAGLRPERFDARTVPTRLSRLDRDPWADCFELAQELVADTEP